MISKYLSQILSARYGRDVRQAIHDGIQQCYYDGKAGEIDLQARQDIETLNSEVDSLKKADNATNKNVQVLGDDVAVLKESDIAKGKDIQTLKSDVETLQNANDIIETTETSIPNTHDGGIKINSIAGAVEQKRYSGKNLIPYPYHQAFPRVNRGITFDDNGDGGILCNGVADTTSQPYFMCELNTLLLKAGQAYTFSSNCNNENGFIVIYFRDGSTNTSITYTEIRNGVELTITANYISEYRSGKITNGVTVIPSQDTYIQLDVRFINNGATIENAVFYPQLELGTERTEWEKYVGGTVSPNPDYQQEIQNADFTEIKTVGMNLIPFPYYRGKTYTHRGITYDVDENGVITLNGTSTDISWCALIAEKDFIPLEDGETCYVWIKRSNAGNATLFFRHYYLDDNGVITDGNHTSAQYFRVTGSSEIRKLGVAVGVYNAGETCNNAKIEIMIVKGDYEFDDLTYYPPKSSTAAISFIGRAIEVSANDDYTYEKDGKYYVADIIERIDGGYQKIQRIGKCVFDGINNKAYGISTADNPYGISFYSNKNDIITNGLMPTSGFSDKYISSHFVGGVGGYVSNTDKDLGNLIYSSTTSIWFSLQKNIATTNGITSVDTFNTWLQSNNVSVHYIRKKPIVTNLSDEEATALLSLKSFDNVTHITTDGKVQPIIDVEYGTSKVGAISLESDNDNIKCKIVLDKHQEMLGDYQKDIEELQKKPYGILSTDNVNYYVDGINGSDNNDGTKQKPFKTFNRFLEEYFKLAEIRCIFIGDCDEYTMDSIETFNAISMHIGNESNADNITIHFNGVHTPAFYNCHLNVGGTAGKYFTLDIPNDLYFDGGSWTMSYAHITNGMLGMNGGYAICNYCTFDDARLRIAGGTGYVRGCTFNGINSYGITCINGGNLYVRTSLISNSVIEDIDNNGVYGVIVGYGARIMLGCVLTTGESFSGRGLYLQESMVLCNDSRFATWNINEPHFSSSALLGNTYQFLHN